MSEPNQRLQPEPPAGFRECALVRFIGDSVHTLTILVPLSFTRQEEAARTILAHEQSIAYEFASRRRRADEENAMVKEADEERGRKSLEGQNQAPTPSKPKKATKNVEEPSRAKTGDLHIEAERDFLQSQAKVGTKLARRPFERVLNARRAKDSQLFVKLFEWDHIMTLISRVGNTADRDSHKRNRDLFLRIRKMHPHHMRPVGYPLQEHEAVLSALVQLEHELPHFAAVLAFAREHLNLSFRLKQPMHLPPVLLLGPPGIGKTHFAKCLAEALRVPVYRHTMDGGITDSTLIGSDKRWGNSATGLMFEALVLGLSASPVVLLDEIDKARSSAQGNALGPLHSLLEPVSAKAVTDISAEITMDASHVVWIATANEPLHIPAPIRSRMHEFLIEAPTGEAALRAADAIAKSVHARMDSEQFDPPDRRVVVSLAHLPARELIQALVTGYARASAAGSRTVQRHHLPADALHDDEKNTADSTKPGGYLH